MTNSEKSKIEDDLYKNIIHAISARGSEIFYSNRGITLMHAHYLAWNEFKAKHLNDGVRPSPQQSP